MSESLLLARGGPNWGPEGEREEGLLADPGEESGVVEASVDKMTFSAMAFDKLQ